MMLYNLKKHIIFIADIIFIISIAFIITWTFFTRILMQGFSMSPAVNNRDVVYVNRLYKNMLKIKRYDIIAFYINDKENIKRVIGLPGDNIRISSSNIYINDEKINTVFFQNDLSSYLERNLIVGKDEYYVLGDNLDSSKDSRFDDVGNIHKSQIIGKVWHINKSK